MPFAIRTYASLFAAGAIVVAVGCSDDTPTQPSKPNPPANLQVAQLTLTSVRISWEAVTGAAAYVLQRADANTPGTFTQVGGSITGTSYDDVGLTAGLAYSYRVAAVAGGQQSDFTTAVSVTTGVQAATLSGNVTASRTLYKDTVYTLSGFVKIQNGATLTIQAGTKIVGDTTVGGSSLWALRGAKIVAIGTAAEPIVFTSARSPGNRKPGDWGGVIIIGNGIINRTGSPILTEGPEAEDYSGGTDNADSSGVFRYVRFEFAGFDVSNGAGQELNSLTMYAVGSGTKLEYVESVSGLDDSFEWFGGAVQGRYILSYESGDDHFDWSEGFRGKLQYIVAFQTQRLQPAPGTGTVSSDPRAFEGDGCDPGVSGCTVGSTGASEPFSNPTFVNFTLIGPGNIGGWPSDGNGMVLRRATAAWLHNGIVTRFKGIGCQMRDAFTDSLRLRDSLAINNVLFAENTGGNYDDPASTTRFCQEAKFAASNHRTAATAAELFVSLNPVSLDFTPPGGAASETGGGTIALPAARASNFFGGTMPNTSYVGAADPTGAKWWEGWSVYLIN